MSFLFYFINITTSVFIISILLYMYWDFYRSKNKYLFPLGLIVVLIIIIFFAGLILTHFVANKYFFDAKSIAQITPNTKGLLEKPGLLGDSAGVMNALFSALAFGGVIYTLLLQRKEMDSNQKENAIEKFETKFYEMIHLHKQNVDEIVVGGLKGRNAIEQLFKDFVAIYAHVDNVIIALSPQFQLAKQQAAAQNDAEEVRKIDREIDYLAQPLRKLKFIHELSYGYFFYGYENYHLTKDISDVRFDLNADITTYIRINGVIPALTTPHNSQLGHYYRHLYQTVKLVAEDETIKEEKNKYKYVKMLRAQLSDFEQALLYYNGLSIMGAKWVEPIGETNFEKMCYIARFRLIKNTPYYINYVGIRPGNYFRVEKEQWELQKKKFFEIDLI